MPDEKKPRSRSHERRASVYLEPSNRKALDKYIEAKSCSESAALNDAVRLLREQFSPSKPVSKNSY